jgi:hypothetical protein
MLMANKPAPARMVPAAPNGGVPTAPAQSLFQQTSSRMTKPLIRGVSSPMHAGSAEYLAHHRNRFGY